MNHLQKRDTPTGHILQGLQNRTVYEGSTISFTCTGNNTVDDIAWNTNRSLNVSTHINNSGVIVSTLTMVAHLWYNGAVIWCSAVCGGELCGRSERAILTVRKSLTISFLSQSVLGSSSSLRYQGGDCTWKLSGILTGEDVIRTGPQIGLGALATGVGIVCEVGENVLLQAVILHHDTVPPPHNVTLDTVNKKLQWDHPFLPQLPPLFELIYGFTITYQVYGKKDGVHMPSLSGLVPNNSFDLTSESDYCAEYDFVVQALIANISCEHPVQNSSSVSGYLSVVPSFRNLSAVAKRYDELYLHIHVAFVLEEEDCPGTHPTFFIVNLTRIGEHKLDINSTHIDDGEGLFLIQLPNPLPNTCYLEGTIFGGNDAGNCTACEIQHPKGSQCSSVTMTSRITTTVMGPSSPVPPPGSPESSHGINLFLVIGIPAGLLIGMTVIAAVVLIVIIVKRKRDRVLPHKVKFNEYSAGYIRSDGPSGNENYLEVVQPTNVNPPSSSVSDHKMIPDSFPSTQYANNGPPADTASECPQSMANFTVSQGKVIYTEVTPIASKPVPPCDTSPTGYVIVDHQKTQEMAQERKSISDEQHSTTASQCSAPAPETAVSHPHGQREGSGLTLANFDELLAILKAHVSKWYELGSQLNLSETLLDEMHTNIDTDEQCLKEILRNWLSYHEPSLEKLNAALARMNEPTLLYDACNRDFVVLNETPPELPPR